MLRRALSRTTSTTDRALGQPQRPLERDGPLAAGPGKPQEGRVLRATPAAASAIPRSLGWEVELDVGHGPAERAEIAEDEKGHPDDDESPFEGSLGPHRGRGPEVHLG